MIDSRWTEELSSLLSRVAALEQAANGKDKGGGETTTAAAALAAALAELTESVKGGQAKVSAPSEKSSKAASLSWVAISDRLLRLIALFSFWTVRAMN